MATGTKQREASPAVVALQWFTYAMWGWMCLAFAWLVGTSVSHYVDPSFNDNSAPGVSYALAAFIVLFITAQISDALYSRWDKAEKHGATMVVMILHAVLFALASIGALIMSVFALTSLLIGDGFGNDENGRMVMLITGFVVSLLFALLTVRVVWPHKLPRRQAGYRLIVAAAALVAFVVALIGPVAYTYQTRPDRLVEAGLPPMARDINSFAAAKNRLPKNLQEVAFVDDASRELVKHNKVQYLPNTTPKLTSSTGVEAKAIAMPYPGNSAKTYYYQLCVTYKGKNNQNDKMYYTEPYPVSSSEPMVYSHDAGRKCYDLVTYDYGVVQPADAAGL